MEIRGFRSHTPRFGTCPQLASILSPYHLPGGAVVASDGISQGVDEVVVVAVFFGFAGFFTGVLLQRFDEFGAARVDVEARGDGVMSDEF